MMLDDNSLLSAYLDDELDPASRFEVENALLTDPRLAEELHELAGVRELLAGLPRPASSRDLAVEVGAKTRWPPRSPARARAFPDGHRRGRGVPDRFAARLALVGKSGST